MLQALAPLASSLEVLDLSDNELGGTIPSHIKIFTKLKKLALHDMGLDGEICRTQQTCVVCLLKCFSCFTGELPKQLPVSLEVLNLGDYQTKTNNNKFTGGIPSEWGALTNLKKLTMTQCGLDGAICMSRPTFALWDMRITTFGVRLHSDERREDGTQDAADVAEA